MILYSKHSAFSSNFSRLIHHLGLLGLFVCLTIGLASGLTACSSGEDGPGGSSRKVPVKTIQVVEQQVQQTLAVVGHVEPSASVRLTSQVNGQLMESFVQPGHRVKAGQLLFRLDPRSYRAAVSQAKAVLARDNAKLALARQDLTRYKGLAARDFLSKQQYEQSLTEVAALEATISEDKALLEAAEVQLGHTTISAPIAGRVGELLVDPGNIVAAGATELLVINTISPAEVSFAVPEKYLPELNRRLRAGSVEVRVLPEGDRGEAVSGQLTIIDNTVNRDTGTVAMRAAFANLDERLWPGQFVRVYIVMEEVPQALVIPFRAVLEGVSGQYVYVVDTADEDHRVVVRPVRTVLLDSSSLQVMEGLKAGEIVVTDGQLNLFPDAPVEILADPPLDSSEIDPSAAPGTGRTAAAVSSTGSGV
ncbi:MAG: efflux RND transporter periplasmic adaptor subunit [Deltaproteobacteria bacterium]|jgi:multidrug efflux system membrane fusion protein|nr:efflux RND transporter periplasmic adaptor subunit [Deltaproteobacteria bacterium]